MLREIAILEHGEAEVGEVREMVLRGRESQVPSNLESETEAA